VVTVGEIRSRVEEKYGDFSKIRSTVLNFLLLKESLILHPDEELHRIAVAIPYKDYLKSDYWRIISRYQRYTHHECKMCKSTSNLETHHTQEAYQILGYEYKHLDLLIVLCEKHHKRLHDLEPEIISRSGYYVIGEIVPNVIERVYYYAKKIHGHGDLDEALVYGTRSG